MPKEIENKVELFGVLKLAPMAKPVLTAGSYEIEVGQKFTEVSELNQAGLSKTIRRFTVEAEQVNMATHQIYSVYPPDTSAGKFMGTLPHVILNRRTLPWERTMYEDTPSAPWLALLVFSEDEAIQLRDLKYGEAIKGNDVHIPKLSGSKPDDKTDCRIIDVPVDLFVQILPTKEDLPYLAHVRDVDLDYKVTDSNVKDGGFACVISNRYPKAPEPGFPNVEHTAVLVSLDGFADIIDDKNIDKRKEKLKDKTHVRMFVFTAWTFFCEGQDYNFSTVANGLEVDVLRHNSFKTLNDPLAKILEKGYYPMNHNFREGSGSVSFYRSPLAPGKPIFENKDFGHYADELLLFDEEIGMYNVSYSAAWQLGRLLSMQNESLAKDILAWRIAGKQAAAKKQNIQILNKALGSLAGEHLKETGINAETLEEDKWRNMVPDLKGSVGLMDSIGMKGANLPKKVVEKLTNNVKELLQEELDRNTSGKSQQLRLLEAFGVIGEINHV
ncbi:MAG: hypothetical protein LBU89_11965 [Fibromonadaceae bacterium]|nr:hypothetical protein [Fibromonadaceae bacterium]